MADNWAFSPDNPFNKYEYTRGGGGYNNAATKESNDRRADAFHEGSAQGLPRFATVGVALGNMKAGEMAVVNDRIIKRTKAPASGGGGGGGASQKPANTGSGAATVVTAPRPASKGSVLKLSWPLPGHYTGVDAPLGHGPRIANLPQIEEDPRFPVDQQLERTGVGGHSESMGALSELGWFNTGTGYYPVPGKDLKERIEDGPLEWLFLANNYLLPHMGLREPPKPPFLDEYSHFDGGLFGTWEWRHGANPRTGKDGKVRVTGGGF